MNEWAEVEIFPTKELEEIWLRENNEDRAENLPPFKRLTRLYTMPLNFPMGLPAKKVMACSVDEGCKTIEPQPLGMEVMTGRIGTITGMTLITDAYVPNFKYFSKHVYAMVHRKGRAGKNRVLVYVWERNPEKHNTTYWYEYPSARVAHVEMKRYGIWKRT